MATIDLIVLGILKKESLSAYDIQKIVEYRNISKWVEDQYTFYLQKSHPAGEKRIYERRYCKRRKYGGKDGLFFDGAGREAI